MLMLFEWKEGVVRLRSLPTKLRASAPAADASLQCILFRLCVHVKLMFSCLLKKTFIFLNITFCCKAAYFLDFK